MCGRCAFHLLTCGAVSAGLPEGWRKTAGKIINTGLPEISTIYTTRRLRRAHNILRDQHRPAHHLFHLLPSGRRYRLICNRNRQTGPQPLPPRAASLPNEHFWSGAMPAWRGSKKKISRRHTNSLLYGNDKKKKYWILNLLTYVSIFTLRFPRWHLPAGSAGHMTASALSKVSSVYTRHKHLFVVQWRLKWRNVSLRQLVFTAVAQNVPRVGMNNSKMDNSNLNIWRAAALNHRAQPAWQEMRADRR